MRGLFRQSVVFVTVVALVALLVPIVASRPVARAQENTADASATRLEWVATSPAGAVVTLNASNSSPDLTVFDWYECFAATCTTGAFSLTFSNPGADKKVWDVPLSIGVHWIRLEGRSPSGSWVRAEPITVTVTEAPAETPTPSATATAEASPSPSASPDVTPVATETPTEAPTVPPTPTTEPSQTPTVEPTETPTLEPTNTPEPPTNTPTPEPTDTPEPPTSTPTPVPTDTPAPPTETSTPEPTSTPTAEPTNTPIPAPTDTPTPLPATETPTAEPSPTPTETAAIPTATETPTMPAATNTPTPTATTEPTVEPTIAPPVVDASATQSQWPAFSEEGALVHLDGSRSTGDFRAFGWFECGDEACQSRTSISGGYHPSFKSVDRMLPVGNHRVVLVGLLPDSSDSVTSAPITITVLPLPATETPTPAATPTTAPTSTPTPEPTATNTPVPTPTTEPIVTPTVEPTATNTPTPEPTPTTEPSMTPTPEPTATATPQPTATPTIEPTATPSPEPTATPQPTATPTPEPTNTPTPEPTATPTPLPTETPTPQSTDTPTPVPTDTPIPVPTATPTIVPTSTPTPTPTPIVYVVDAGATQREWIATSAQGAYVLLDGSRSTPDMATYGWFECANEFCTLRDRLSPDYAPEFRNYSTWLSIGEHTVFLVARTSPTGDFITSSMITITVTTGGPTATPTPQPTQTPQPTATVVMTPSPTPSPNPSPTVSPSPTASPSPTVTITPAASPTATITATPSSTATPTVTATSTPSPTATATPSPRIRVSPSAAIPGQRVTVSLSGFGANQAASVRWLVNGRWTAVGSITTGSDGNGSAQIPVPANAAAGANKVRADSSTRAAQTGAVTVTIPAPASAALNITRGGVGALVNFTVSNFAPNSTVTITWKRPRGSTVALGSVTTGNTGGSGGLFAVPSSTAGVNAITFSDGSRSATAQYTVQPRIVVAPSVVSAGSRTTITLRGYGKSETVRIRWLVNGVWITLATVQTNNTGGASVTVTVPANAAAGSAAVRGDGTVNRQQTNGVTVLP